MTDANPQGEGTGANGIKAVIFDFGGVLIRHVDFSGHHKWIERLGLQESNLFNVVYDCEASRLASLGKLTVDEVWVSVAAQFLLDDAQLEELRADFEWGAAMDDELVEFLRSLRPRFKTAILSNSWPGARDYHTNTSRLASAVDLLFLSDELGLAKPDPQIYRAALDALGVQPHEAIFVDDLEPNVRGAQDLGMHAILYRSTQQVIEDIKQLTGEKEPIS